jgi:hypothetical protein
MIPQTNDGSHLTHVFQLKMNQTRVLLSIDQTLHAQLLKHVLLSREDVEVVGETEGLLDSLRMIAAEKPDLWIHSWSEEADGSAALSHAHNIHPNLAVLRVDPDEPAGVLHLQISSLSQLMEVASCTRPFLNRAPMEIAANAN